MFIKDGHMKKLMQVGVRPLQENLMDLKINIMQSWMTCLKIVFRSMDKIS